jgi:hypothetical protein
MRGGRDSTGQIKPAENTMGKEEKSTIGVAISLEENNEPKKRPNEIDANKNATPKVRISEILPMCVTEKCSKL